MNAAKRNETLIDLSNRIKFSNKLIWRMRREDNTPTKNIKFEKGTLSELQQEFNKIANINSTDTKETEYVLINLKRIYGTNTVDKTINIQM
jgi:hypothetical protein